MFNTIDDRSRVLCRLRHSNPALLDQKKADALTQNHPAV